MVNKLLDNLSVQEKKELFKQLSKLMSDPVCCPYCKSDQVVRHGFYIDKNVRYRCNNCGKTFKNDIEYLGLRDVEGYVLYKNAIRKWRTILYDAKKHGKTVTTITKWRNRIYNHLIKDK